MEKIREKSNIEKDEHFDPKIILHFRGTNNIFINSNPPLKELKRVGRTIFIKQKMILFAYILIISTRIF